MNSKEPLPDSVAAEHDDARLAVRLADQAGDLLLKLQHESLDEGRSGQWLKDEGDRRAQAFLSAQLQQYRPHDAILSEEAADDPKRLTADRVWIIDPLDGTREFSEGREDWAVHVALWIGGELALGAVALPGLGVVLDSSESGGDGPDLNGRRLRIAVSRSRAPQLVNHVAAAMEAELVPMGSAGYKASAVARREVDAYIHSGGQYEWDSAAPVVVAHEWGLHTSRIDGSRLLYNQADPYLPDLLVCRPELAESLLAAIEQHREGTND